LIIEHWGLPENTVREIELENWVDYVIVFEMLQGEDTGEKERGSRGGECDISAKNQWPTCAVSMSARN